MKYVPEVSVNALEMLLAGTVGYAFNQATASAEKGDAASAAKNLFFGFTAVGVYAGAKLFGTTLRNSATRVKNKLA